MGFKEPRVRGYEITRGKLNHVIRNYLGTGNVLPLSIPQDRGTWRNLCAELLDSASTTMCLHELKSVTQKDDGNDDRCISHVTEDGRCNGGNQENCDEWI